MKLLSAASVVLALFASSASIAIAQYPAQPTMAYVWNAGTSQWQAVIGTGTPVTGIYPPQPIALYCVDNSGNPVKADTTGNCFGSSYTLPIATPTTLGGVKPDNTTCTVNGTTGVLTCGGSGTGFVFVTTQTVTGSPAASISFTAIPGTAKNIEIKCAGQSAGVDLLGITFNNDTTAAHYNSVRLSANGGGTVGGAGFVQTVGYGFVTYMNVGDFAAKISVPNYTGTVITGKGYNSEGTWVDNAPFPYLEHGAGSWTPSSPTAITRIDLVDETSTMSVGTTCTLYGLP